MKLASFFVALLTATPAMAAPTYLEALQALVILADANNEMDGEMTYLVCMDEVYSTENETEVLEDWIQVNKVQVFRTVAGGEAGDGGSLTTQFDFLLKFGPYYSYRSSELLGTTHLGEIEAFCPQNTFAASCVRNSQLEISCGFGQ